MNKNVKMSRVGRTTVKDRCSTWIAKTFKLNRQIHNHFILGDANVNWWRTFLYVEEKPTVSDDEQLLLMETEILTIITQFSIDSNWLSKAESTSLHRKQKISAKDRECIIRSAFKHVIVHELAQWRLIHYFFQYAQLKHLFCLIQVIDQVRISNWKASWF